MLQTDKVKEFVERFYTDHDWVKESELIVYYPEITIVNDHNAKHTIFDTYVKFHIIENRLFVSVFRAKLKLSEIQSAYYHSHMSYAGHRNGWNSDLCYGLTGSIFNLTGEGDKLDAKIINAFIFVDKFLKTESKYTNPYGLISSISSQNYRQYNTLVYDSRFATYPDFLTEINYNVDFTVKFDKDFIQACIEYFNETKFFYFIKSDNKFFFKNALTNNRFVSYYHSEIMFKGEFIRSETIDDAEKIDNAEWQINPLQLVNIKKYYDKEIEKVLEKKESLIWEDTRLELPSPRKSITRLPEESEIFV